MPRSILMTAGLLLVLVGASSAAPPADFKIRIDGKVLRKASGKLVLSLSSFELGDQKEVGIENLKTGEKRKLKLSSVYWDICYTETISPDAYQAMKPSEWIPFVEWTVPGDMDSLRGKLSTVYDYQNRLRRELGNASLDEEGANVKVSSRLTLNKIEKFHRIAALLAAEYLKKAREADEVNTYLYPLRIQIGYNPFGTHVSRSHLTPLREVREIIYWEVHRILTQQFGIDESLVDFVFDSPSTVRHLIPLGATSEQDLADFFPNITVGGEAIDCALYLQRQGFGDQVRQLVKYKMYRDPFIKDRHVVDQVVNEGVVVDVYGGKAAVSFIPPFMKPGEKIAIGFDEDGTPEAQTVLAGTVEDGGYSLTEELEERLVSRIRAGMPVFRK